MCKSDPPPPPDYRAAAQQQGTENRETAYAQSVLNNPNTVTPYGSQTVTYDWGQQAKPPTQGSAPPWAQYGSYPGSSYGGSSYGGSSYGGRGYEGSGVPQATITQTFSDTEQGLYDSESALKQGLLDTAQTGLKDINTTMGTAWGEGQDFGEYGNIDPSQYQNVDLPSNEGLQGYTGIDRSQLSPNGDLNYDGLQGMRGVNIDQLPDRGNLTTEGLDPWGNAIDTSQLSEGSQGLSTQGLPELQNYDFSKMQELTNLDLSQLDPRSVQASVGGRQDVVEALRAREAPRFDQERNALEADLMARGFNPGSTGYDERLAQFDRQKNDFDLATTIRGGEEQQRLFDMEYQLRAQGMSEQQARLAAEGMIRQQSVGEQGLQIDNAANQRSTLFGEQQEIEQFKEGLRARGLSEQQIEQESANMQRQAQFGERQDVANYADSQRAAGLGEQQNQVISDTGIRQQQAMERQRVADFAQLLRAQGMSEQQVEAQINAAIRAGQFGEEMSRFGAEQSVRGQDFLEDQTQQRMAADINNMGRQHYDFERNARLREMNSLRSGNSPQMPNFQGFSGGGNIAPAPIYGAAQDAGNYAMDAWMNQGGGLSDILGAGLGAAGAAGGFGNLFSFK